MATARYEIKKVNGSWAIFIKVTGDEFQNGFDSLKQAEEFLEETFG